MFEILEFFNNFLFFVFILDDDLSEALITDHVGDENDPAEEADDGNHDFDVPYPVMDTSIPCRDLSRSKNFFLIKLLIPSLISFLLLRIF